MIASAPIAIFPFICLPYRSCIAAVAIDETLPFSVNYLEYTALAKIPCLSLNQNHIPLSDYHWLAVEPLQVDWLIAKFNQYFAAKNTILVRGNDEPEYFAATDDKPAQIVFAHGFFASALHEISHWCVAGKRRRLLDDFGYWYAPDGRNAAQQQAFEKVEIVPQAIECLLTLSCNKNFRVSVDNLTADFDINNRIFANNVATQALAFWTTGHKLPTDAKDLLNLLRPLRPLPLSNFVIQKNFITA